MNVFELRDKLISDYCSYVKGFIKIKDPAIRELVDKEMDAGLLWPDPLIQLSPFFDAGGSIDDLVNDGILHPQCSKIFRIGKDEDNPGTQMQLHRHQRDAIQRAAQDDNYVLTTGTGSGKSLAYIIPIVNHILKTGSGKGIKAIIIYPMNALANSQENELDKFINKGMAEDAQRITFNRYTGQESDSEKRAICQNPPDILLTNYVMLELILTRPEESRLVKACRNLKFLVLDELHTYRGRQGADVAMLIRRTIDAAHAQDVIRVGTSATLSSASDPFQQSQEIARVATLLFGSEVKPENVIGETLQRLTHKFEFDNPKVIAQLKSSVTNIQNQTSLSFDDLKSNAFFSWIETNFGVDFYPNTDILKRAEAKSISGSEGAAAKLSNLTGLATSICSEAIQRALMLGYQTKNPANGFPAFAFKVHQFISRGDAVYASLDAGGDRHLTVQRQVYVPDSDKSKVLLPLVFCRHCGQDYYIVYREKNEDTGIEHFRPRDLYERITPEDSEAGYLISNFDKYWEGLSLEKIEKLPEEWKDQEGKILNKFDKYLPKQINVNPLGQIDDSGHGMLYLKAPFLFCPKCFVSYAANQRSDFVKLTGLGTEGRSTATTILSLSAVRHIRNMDLPEEAQKLLSFTDNRQDASLQSGHFNDFVQVGLLRGALYQALNNKGDAGAQHSELTQIVFDSLNLSLEEYASNLEATKGNAKTRADSALKNVLGYRIYHDLRRGWRITAPNLEQTGLLKIEYPFLEELAADEEQWQDTHEALAKASPNTRKHILKTLLDWMRWELAIKVDYLEPNFQSQILQLSSQRLRPPWGFDENEEADKLAHAVVLYPRSSKKSDNKSDRFLSPRSSFGQFLRLPNTFSNHKSNLTLDDTHKIIQHLLDGLNTYGIIEIVRDADKDGVPGYQIVADSMIWKAGDGTQGVHDPLRQISQSDAGQSVNPYFREFYKSIATSIRGMCSREHTAQVSYEERVKREIAFSTAELPILYCSPTMELGIDISQLNMVNMRNAPPTPANYAQRSGRAGRSGQPALVFTYCSTGSPHDQYFFKRPQKMVSGSVATPQIDLANEDMLRAHVHAIWLSEANINLGSTLAEILEVSGDSPTLELLPDIKAALSDNAILQRTLKRAKQILTTLEANLTDSVWYTHDWLTDTLKQLPASLEDACERWRGLFRAAQHQKETQNKIAGEVLRKTPEKNRAERLWREAIAQLNLLTDASSTKQSDFYSYRYFASEGFLPGYNFPRLPLSAFIPGRRMGRGKDEYLTRPRFLAITEFGPNAIIYHEGSRYSINRVIMPARTEDSAVSTSEAKLCPACGYLHEGDMSVFNICEHCGQELGPPIPNLFRLQNVVAKRKDQINCDEEERSRRGYEIRSAVRFTSRSGQLSSIKSQVVQGEDCIATLTYGDSATIWRINLGYKKRKSGDPDGFKLSTERGLWERAKEDQVEDDASPLSGQTIRVRPYVSDTKNCLLFEPNIDLSIREMASLQYALKNAIQIVFELEDNELAAEPLPDKGNRKSILFYEATEGGAGVLKRVINQKEFHEVIKAAIEICHYDPNTFEDLKKATGAKENCEAACYDCLMSYTNQTDHELLDRKSLINHLKTLFDSTVQRSSSNLSREQHYQQLKSLCQSTLETMWLDYIYTKDYILPTHAQRDIESCYTRPDFLYEGKYVAIYVDGPPHDKAGQKEKDKQITDQLENLGWHVIRFRHDDDWDEIIKAHKSIFGFKSQA